MYKHIKKKQVARNEFPFVLVAAIINKINFHENQKKSNELETMKEKRVKLINFPWFINEKKKEKQSTK